MQRGRPKVPLTIPDQDRVELLRWIKRPKTSNGLGQRAAIVLRCAEGLSNSVVASQLRVTNATVDKWRPRYIGRGLAGLLDEPRCGAPRRIDDGQVETLLIQTLESMPRDATHWSTRAMAARSGLSHTSVRRIWHAFGLRPHRVANFKLSNRSAIHPEGPRHRRPVPCAARSGHGSLR